jgi:hypothetical protein
MLLEVLLGGRDDLESDELEATLLESGDDITDKATLAQLACCSIAMYLSYLNTVGLDSNEAVAGSG